MKETYLVLDAMSKKKINKSIKNCLAKLKLLQPDLVKEHKEEWVNAIRQHKINVIKYNKYQ